MWSMAQMKAYDMSPMNECKHLSVRNNSPWHGLFSITLMCKQMIVHFKPAFEHSMQIANKNYRHPRKVAKKSHTFTAEKGK